MDQPLRTRVRAGDPDAFGELFDRHARAVNALAYRLTGNRQDAEEVVSLTYLEAWRLRAKVDADGDSLVPWLLGITVNVARNRTRANRRHQAAMARLPQPNVEPDFADEVAGRLDDAVRVAAAQAALRKLRPDEQDVVALCVWSGLDYAAAAAALDIPVGTVRSRLSRARRKLRAMAGELVSGGGQFQSAGVITSRPARGGVR